jgi:hypothetical protein
MLYLCTNNPWQTFTSWYDFCRLLQFMALSRSALYLAGGITMDDPTIRALLPGTDSNRDQMADHVVIHSP